MVQSARVTQVMSGAVATPQRRRRRAAVDTLATLCTHTNTTDNGTASHFVAPRPSDPGIQRPGDLVDPVTLFYNELPKISQAREFLIIIGKSKSSLYGLTSSDFSLTTDT